MYRLSLVAYDTDLGFTDMIQLGRFAGSPGDADAPLWTRRLMPGRNLRFSQPRAFVAKLIAGMTDIPVRHIFSVSLSYQSYLVLSLTVGREM